MVGVLSVPSLGYDDDMPDSWTLLILIIALAMGLSAAIFAAQKLQSSQSMFHSYYLTHILLFNLLILAGLVFRYLQPQSQFTHPAVLPTVLLLMAGLKLGWLYSFVVSTRLLTVIDFPKQPAARFARIELIVLGVYIAISSLAWFGRAEILLQIAIICLESFVLGTALLAAGHLLTTTRQLPHGARRNSLLSFGIFHLSLLAVILAVFFASWFRSGSEEFAQLMIYGAFLILFNAFPLFWIRFFLPLQDESRDKKFAEFGITRREKQVILLIQAGKTNQEIADELFISLATVKDHNNNLFRKCEVRNRVELTNLFR
jgi:DNA-binding CsgD family transcriptional regulator